MTDEEFDVIDELYFVQHFSYLKESLGWEEQLILQTLSSLQEKGYIKCLTAPDEEVFEKIDLLEQGRKLYFLATKKGLMEHNAL
ncbi:hypothetical protein [Arthrospiribacter ruber]|uniref:Uncharacterized protein n=1 Tax=Arthrospiribacter ruber TaxID=2487934 RepID=A0A951J618_9BACT|nr:hypothetical protein [Arthrospiribacter ruber]MBW3470363.1 hypothetical protein [Arthrospiribacter ruber]